MFFEIEFYTLFNLIGCRNLSDLIINPVKEIMYNPSILKRMDIN